MDYYYLHMKNKIIAELNQKIKIINSAFNENYNIHKNYFNLIWKILSVSKKTFSDIPLESLNSLTRFTFPKIEIDSITNLDEKVNALSNFYQNNYMISEEKEPIELFNKFKEIKIDITGKVIELSDKRLLYYDYHTIKIHNQYNFNIELTINIPGQVGSVCELGKNKLVIGSLYPYICYLDKTEYSLTQFPVFHDSFITKILLLQNELILTHSSSKSIISNSKFPFEIKKIITYPKNHSFVTVKQLRDGRLFFIFFSNKQIKFHFYNDTSIKAKKKVISPKIDFLLWDQPVFELKNQNVVLYNENYLFIYNPHLYQIESKIHFQPSIMKISNNFHINNCLCIIFKKQFKIINLTSLQTIFTFSCQIEHISDCLLLGNGILLCLSPKNKKIKKLKKKLDNFKKK